MRAPEFWNHRDGPEAAVLTRALLTPASWLYQAGTAFRWATTPALHLGPAVICVGNVTVGGTGKTPVAIAILKRLRARGVNAQALSRGYGGRRRRPLLVDPDKHAFRDVGDEPLLIARAGPTWVAKSKLAGGRAAARQGADVVVMDDGFQNPTIGKDLSLVLIDAQAGFGNGAVFPAGPLRESVRSAMRRADAVVLVVSGEDPVDTRSVWRAHLPADRPVLTARFAPSGPLPTGPIFAFAGIGRPKKFFDAIVRAGGRLAATATFPDHHVYTRADMVHLRENARRYNANLVTTEKDHARIEGDVRRLIHAWPINAAFDDEAALDALLDRAIDRASGRR